MKINILKIFWIFLIKTFYNKISLKYAIRFMSLKIIFCSLQVAECVLETCWRVWSFSYSSLRCCTVSTWRFPQVKNFPVWKSCQASRWHRRLSRSLWYKGPWRSANWISLRNRRRQSNSRLWETLEATKRFLKKGFRTSVKKSSTLGGHYISLNEPRHHINAALCHNSV